MAYLLGTDEAGYGPNLGPLVVSATLWEIPGQSRQDLYEVLEQCVGRKPAARRIAVADSKQLYSSGGQLTNLEQGVLSCLAQVRPLPTSWRGFWEAVSPHALPQLAELPWYETFDCPVPVHADVDEVAELSRTLTAALEDCEVRLVDIRAAAIFPRRFNQLVAERDGKGAALSHVTLELIRDLIEPLDAGPIFVQCDKHGGRNRYGSLLQGLFPDYLVEVLSEGRQESSYRWGPGERRVDCRFTAKGESFLPSALASMYCKYLRELAMFAFNQYWCNRVPGLRPTAGYPQDAKRFRTDVAQSLADLKVEPECFWRAR